MRYVFVFPADVLNPRQIDPLYAAEAALLRAAGFTTARIALDELFQGAAVIPALSPEGVAVYRGWMLAPEQYAALLAACAPAQPLTSLELYLHTHYLPRWYPLLHDLTPETVVLPHDQLLEQRLRELDWSAFFIKDYVKSLKTGTGSIITDPSQITTLVEQMHTFRGTIEGGLCVRRVEAFDPATERRFFVLHGQPYAADPSQPVPQLVDACAERISSRFFSVDVVSRHDGVERVVEIGDGQVSDFVGWTPDRFVQLWQLRS